MKPANMTTCPICGRETDGKVRLTIGLGSRWRFALTLTLLFAVVDAWLIVDWEYAASTGPSASELTVIGVSLLARLALLYGFLWGDYMHAPHAERIPLRVSLAPPVLAFMSFFVEKTMEAIGLIH